MSWQGLDHATIYEMVVNQGDGPEISRAAEDGWSRIQDVIVNVESDIRAAMRASEDGWEGSGADAMRTGYTPLGAWVLSAAADASRTATAVTEQAAMAANTRRLVADNPPPQHVGQHLHSFFGGLDGDSVYRDQAAAVDQLMTTYDTVSGDNEQRFDTWSVPPSIVVTPAAAGPSGPGGTGVGALPDVGGVAPAGGVSAIEAALSPGSSVAGGGALPTGAGAVPAGGMPPGGVAGGGTGPAGIGPVPGVGGTPPAGTGGAGASTPGAAGSGALGAGGSVGRGGAAVGGPDAAAPGAVGSGSGRGVGSGPAGRGAPGFGTGGAARPSERPLGSRGGSGSGPGPWTRAATEAGRSPAGATPFRPIAPAVPPRTSVPDWRSVLLPPEREPAASTRGPGEPAARPAGPGGSTATPAAAQGSGARGAGSPGMHGTPMMGGGAGGAQGGEGRRRASYLIDDSDAFVDKRWFTEPVMTPDDPL